MPHVDLEARVLEARPLNPQTVVLTLEAPQIACLAEPGQFVAIACDHYLRRPIGIMQSDHERTIRVGIRRQGQGSSWIADRQAGDRLQLLGPLGRGFDLNYRHIITVGGGTGVFPLFFVQQVCRERGIDALAVCGYRSRQESVLADAYSQLGCRTLFAADAGDLDIAGNAADALVQVLETLDQRDNLAILTCGPRLMMQQVAGIAGRFGLPCQVSLEERMACGIGVCLVCACQVQPEAGQDTAYRRCCVEGPVFAAEEVVW